MKPETAKPSVLLLGHYPFDGHKSMTRYADTVAAALRGHGFEVEQIEPKPIFGRLRPGAEGLSKWLGYVDKFVLFPIAVAARLRRARAAQSAPILCLPDHSHGIYLHWFHRYRHVIHCHDLMAVRSALGEIPQNPVSRSGRWYQKLILSGLAKGREAVCVSAATAEEMGRLLGSTGPRLTVVPNCLNHPFRRIEAGAARRALADDAECRALVEAPFILHVGGNQWYKNRVGVVRIFERFRALYRGSDIRLALVGSAPDQALLDTIKSSSAGASIYTLTEVDDTVLNHLYGAATCLLFPSHMEGFGWPILEAQASGCPVLTTDAEPMRWVGGEGAVLLATDPSDPAGVDSTLAAERIHGLLNESDADRGDRLQKAAANLKRFDASETAAQMAAVYQR